MHVGIPVHDPCYTFSITFRDNVPFLAAKATASSLLLNTSIPPILDRGSALHMYNRDKKIDVDIHEQKLYMYMVGPDKLSDPWTALFSAY